MRVVVALVVLTFACGDDSSPPICPEGFVQEDGLCIPVLDAGPSDAGVDGEVAGDSGVDSGDDTLDGCSVMEETCNGLDDDCDSMVDEALTRSCGSDLGLCVAGTQACVDGEFGDCMGETLPTDEVCEGVLDEDCDGTVDNGCDCIPATSRECGSSEGSCEVGEQLCGDDGTYDACVGSVGPADETCNGVDDDCDGSIDEENPGGGGSCGSSVGACVEGVSTCMAGGLTCVGEVTPVAETCNTVDDDCDGMTDEGVTTRYFRDEDDDGYGSPSDFVDACSLPSGYLESSTNMDCADQDARAFPGQTMFFNIAIVGSREAGFPAFDFDCSGVEKEAVREASSMSCAAECSPSTRWRDSVPACGVVGVLVMCSAILTPCTERSSTAIAASCR